MTAAQHIEPIVLPGAEVVLPPGASRARWLAARRWGIGGSDVAALKGLSNFGSAYSVWEDKTGRGVEQLQTKRMRRGQLHEDAIALEYAEDYGVTVIDGLGLLRSLAHPHEMGTPDRFIVLPDGTVQGLEIKYVEGYGVIKKLDAGDMPHSWWWQKLTYLDVTGLDTWVLAALCVGRDDLWVREMHRSDVEQALDELGPFIENWWTAHVEMDVPPDYDEPHRREVDLKLGDAVEAMVPEAVLADRDRLKEIKANGEAMEAEAKEINARLDAEIGDHRYLAVNGIKVAQKVRTRGTGKFDRKRLRAEQPAIEAQYSTTGKSSTYITLMD